MSLLTICKAVANNAGFAEPSSIVGNSDATARQLLALANVAGTALAKVPWQILQKEYTFATAIGTPDYALPTDYGWFQNDTAWDRTTFWALRGSLSAVDWQAYKSGLPPSSIHTRFRVKAGRMFIDPTPTAIENMVIEYISNAWVLEGSTPRTAFTLDTQTSVIDEYLVQLDLTWRFLNRKGLAYAEEKLEAEEQIELAIGHDVPQNPICLGDYDAAFPPVPIAPLGGFG